MQIAHAVGTTGKTARVYKCEVDAGATQTLRALQQADMNMTGADEHQPSHAGLLALVTTAIHINIASAITNTPITVLACRMIDSG